MKLGETAEGIYSISFNVDEKAEGSEYPIADSAILLTYESGDHEWVDFGTARQETTGGLEFVDIPKADYFTLTAFLKANLGSTVRFTLDYEAENPWGDPALLANESYFYATITDYEDGGEAEFSVDDRLYSVKVKLSYVGTAASANPNSADTSLKDICIEIDTVRAHPSAIVANKAALDSVTSLPGGTIGLTTSDRKVYIYDASVPEWTFLYTLVANNADYGLVNGVFYLSAFADITSGSTGAESKNWKAGLINERSVKFATSSISLDNGPSIENLEGFSFSMNNVDKFWNFIVTNGISLYNALVKQKFYDRTNGVMELHRTGANYNNSFDYHNYTFQVEPEIVNNTNSFPDTVYNKVDHPNASPQMLGKPVIATFGRWQKGELQASNFSIQEQKFPSGRRYISVVSYNSGTKKMVVNIPVSEFLTLLNIAAVGEYPAAVAVKYLYIKIIQQDNQPELNRAKRITAIANSSGNTELTFAEGFTVSPTAGTIVATLISTVELVADDDPMVGFDKPEYLEEYPDGVQTVPKELYAKINNELEQVPDHLYKIVDNENNRLTIDINSIELDDFSSVNVADNTKLEKVEQAKVANILIPNNGGVNRTYNFGFVPEGTKSEEVVDTFQKDNRNFTDYTCTAVPSQDRITIAWFNPVAGTGTGGNNYTKQKIYKYKSAKIHDLKRQLVSVIEITDMTVSYYVDTDVAQGFYYYYQVQFTDSSSGKPDTQLTGIDFMVFAVKLPTNNNQGTTPKVRSIGNASVESVIIWNRQANQGRVKIYREGVMIADFAATTQTYFHVPAQPTPIDPRLDGGISYAVQISIGNAGDNTDTWAIQNGKTFTDFFYLKKAADLITTEKYSIGLHNGSLKVTENQKGYVIKNVPSRNGQTFPAAGAVFTWMVRVDRTKLPDLSNAKDVRLLTDFVIRSYYDNFTQVPVFIQLRGVKSDGSSYVLAQHGSGAGLACKSATPNAGAFGQFLNLPGNKGGTDANYSEDVNASNVDGKYTGKNLWRLPDWLFADDADEWNKIEYFAFVITNAVDIIPAAIDSNKSGYKIGIGALDSTHASNLTRVNRGVYYLEYSKEFEGGLDTPQFARIDGGVIDDGSGTFTGTANKIIERARHLSNYIVYKMLGSKPQYIGDEMKSRDNWICRYQSKEATDVQTMLQMIAKNLWGCFTVSNDDRLIFRTLDIEEPKVQTVFAFNHRNIVKDSFVKIAFRKQSEIFQQYKFKYNFEPSVAVQEGDSNEQKNKNRSYTEEIVVGWDLIKGKKISGGYSRITEDENGNLITTVDDGDENKLTSFCKTSSLLYASGGKVNQFGYDKDELLEFFYRPTKTGTKGDVIEQDLPNLNTIHDPMVRSPKRSVQDRIGREVRFRVFNAWKGSLKCNLKYVLYYNGGDGINPAVNGLKPDSVAADRKLKLMDKITVNHPFYTNGEDIPAFVTGIDPDFYNGTATISFYAYKPPGQLARQIDHRWDAGFGSRNNADFTFKGNDYGLTNEANTFANASYGARVNANFKFPDGTAADSEGKGTGKL